MAKFLDEAKVTFIAGKGGDGIISFHREKYVDKGGPSGGDGGNGGSIFLKGNHNKNTLYEINFKKIIRANHGENGKSKNMHGKNAEDFFISVPLGTIAYDSNGETIGEIVRNDQNLLISKGGFGGRGNAKFKSSVNKVPHLSENGSEGETKEINLELKILADVSLVGFPSTGKSLLISKLTNAKPKIADYEFTTLIPNIGISKYKDSTFVIADIPGLIEGASKGKGLGIEFLKHIERSKLIVHLLDGSKEIEEIKNRYKIINLEMEKFSSRLRDLEQIICINKIDLISEEKKEKIVKYFKNAIFISALNSSNLDILKTEIFTNLERIKNESLKNISEDKKTFHYYKYNPSVKEIVIVKNDLGEYNVSGSLIEYWSKRIPITSDQNYKRFRSKLVNSGIFDRLSEKGWKDGDIINIAISGEIYEFF